MSSRTALPSPTPASLLLCPSVGKRSTHKFRLSSTLSLPPGRWHPAAGSWHSLGGWPLGTAAPGFWLTGPLASWPVLTGHLAGGFSLSEFLKNQAWILRSSESWDPTSLVAWIPAQCLSLHAPSTPGPAPQPHSPGPQFSLRDRAAEGGLGQGQPHQPSERRSQVPLPARLPSTAVALQRTPQVGGLLSPNSCPRPRPQHTQLPAQPHQRLPPLSCS